MTALQRYTVRLTANAREDLLRLYDFLLEKDFSLAQRALQVIDDGLRVLEKFPFTCRKAADGAHGPRLRELVIPFGSTGYVALFEVESVGTVSVLAVRHQREEDYH